jgi:hypothetical protein
MHAYEKCAAGCSETSRAGWGSPDGRLACVKLAHSLVGCGRGSYGSPGDQEFDEISQAGEGVRMGRLGGHGENEASTKQRSRELDKSQRGEAAREERAEIRGDDVLMGR